MLDEMQFNGESDTNFNSISVHTIYLSIGFTYETCVSRKAQGGFSNTKNKDMVMHLIWMLKIKDTIFSNK